MPLASRRRQPASGNVRLCRTPPTDFVSGPLPLTEPRVATVFQGDCRCGIQPVVTEVQTFYEQLFLQQGYPITYLSFVIDHEGP